MENHVTHVPLYSRQHTISSVLYRIIHVQLSRTLVGSVFSPISPLLEEPAVTATHDRLVQGWLNTCDTRVERLLRLLCNRNDWIIIIIHTIVRSFMIFWDMFGMILGAQNSQWNKLFQVSCTLRYQGTLWSIWHCFNSFGCITIMNRVWLFMAFLYMYMYSPPHMYRMLHCTYVKERTMKSLPATLTDGSPKQPTTLYTTLSSTQLTSSLQCCCYCWRWLRTLLLLIYLRDGRPLW